MSAENKPLLDRADVRVIHQAGISGAIATIIDRVKSGDLGSLPGVVGGSSSGRCFPR